MGIDQLRIVQKHVSIMVRIMVIQRRGETLGGHQAKGARYSVFGILIAFGFILSAYLLARTFLILAEATPGKIDLCAATFGASCDSILASRESWMLGIPLAGWGVVFYITLSGLLLLHWLLGSAFDLEATSASFGLILCGACISLFLGLEMLLGWVPLCQVCLIIHVINLALVVVSIAFDGQTFRQMLLATNQGLQIFLGRNSTLATETRWKVVGFINVALLAIVTYQWVYVQSTTRRLAEHPNLDFEPLLTAFETEQQQQLEITAADPQLGPPDASLELVVFSNFQCPGCQDLAGQLERLLKGAGNKLRIVFKHFPLGTPCDADVAWEQLPQICSVALAAQAAQQQGKFWQYHDALFSGDLDADQSELRRIALEIGLDQKLFEADWRARHTREKVRADVELGERLNVSGTPTIFLNGRRIRELNLDAIDMLIRYQAETRSK